PSSAGRAGYEVVLDARALLAQVGDHRGVLDGGDYRARAGMVRAIDQVLLAQHRGTRDDDRAEPERADIRGLPQCDSRQHQQDRVAVRDSMAGENVRDTLRLRRDVREGQARAPALAILEQDRDPARIFGELVDDLGEVEMLRRLPAEVAIRAPITLNCLDRHGREFPRAACSAGACERFAAALMYL